MIFFLLDFKPETVIAWFFLLSLIGSIVGTIVFLFRRQRFYRGFILGGLTGFVLASVVLCAFDSGYTYGRMYGYIVPPPPPPPFWEEVPEGETPPWLDEAERR